ncbi:MAG: hypothetical protein KDA94_07590, partial [Acidimicrobiales bacterium]|nr:hypothetical protein [Acidimicrobiales bacterium]
AIDMVGAAFTDTIDSIVDVVVDHRPLVVALSVTVVVVGLTLERRRGRSQLDDLISLEHEVDAAEHEVPPSEHDR